MYCTNCGKQIADHIAFCPECGTPTGENPSGLRRAEEEPFQYVPQESARSETDGYAIASLILGILGFFILPIIGGILAIVFGNKSIRENGMNTMARVGKILGIICLVLAIIGVVVVVAGLVLVGVGGVMEMTEMTEFM